MQAKSWGRQSGKESRQGDHSGRSSRQAKRWGKQSGKEGKPGRPLRQVEQADQALGQVGR
jgi:hypothetical protein